jgi:UDP-N-acetylglucosamine--N-acetylmuramyl-(pentapeptide) pyrophosphoryl-undecaprenol N-acetylglucosamine transferase
MGDTGQRHPSAFRLAVAGGGTGGHLFPGIAVARALKRRMTDAEVLFVVGRRRPMETDILSRSGFEAVSIDVEGIKGRGWRKGLMVVFKLPKSIFQSAAVIRRFAPSVVLGVGGYSAGPVCAAAGWMGVPTAIHEQNSYPGVTNRLLSRMVDRIFISFEESRPCFKDKAVILTGSPVREEILLSRSSGGSTDRPFTVLVVGGSQGAQAVNRTFVEALQLLQGRGREVTVIHQTGAMDHERVLEDYRSRGLEGEILPFIADMAGAYGRADLVVGRAGASTIFELAALGKPAILIPYPYAANRHQEINANALVRQGGAEMLLQPELTAEALAHALERYMDDRQALQQMGERARRIGRPDAADAIVDQLLEMTANG